MSSCKNAMLRIFAACLLVIVLFQAVLPEVKAESLTDEKYLLNYQTAMNDIVPDGVIFVKPANTIKAYPYCRAVLISCI